MEEEGTRNIEEASIIMVQNSAGSYCFYYNIMPQMSTDYGRETESNEGKLVDIITFTFSE